MPKKTLIFVSLLILLTFALAAVAQAANTKYTFNDVDIDGTIVEIEAGVKNTNKNDYSNCTYFTDDYRDVLGYYADAVDAGDTAEEVLEFCVTHFDEATQ